MKLGTANLESLARSLHRASRTLTGGLERIESKLPQVLLGLSTTEKIDALQVIVGVHQEKQMLTSEILGKLGGNNGNGQKGTRAKGSGDSRAR